jgi:solute carrier family 25 uncoupling protein 8/9
MMNAAPGMPTGLLGIVGHMLKNEGPLSFYKGFQANFLRLGSWNVVMFVTLERIKIYFDPGHVGGH